MNQLANVYYDELQASEIEFASTIERRLTKGRRLQSLEKDHSRLVGALHQPRKRSLVLDSEKKESKRKERHFEVNNYVRMKCIICKQNTSIFCEACNVWLHVNEEGRECWKQYHTKRDLVNNLE